MSLQLKKWIISIVMFILFGFSIALQIKSNIGQSLLNALSLTLSDVLSIKIGTILNMINASFWCLNITIRIFKVNSSDFIQIVATLLNGIVINFFVYNVLGALQIESYAFKLLTLILGILLASATLGMLLAIGIVKFPLESCCITISERLHLKLAPVRFGVDVLFLVVTLILFKVTDVPLYMREGTLISFALISYLLGLAYKHFKRMPFLQ